MRDVPVELVERIESGAATLCYVWILTRADGEVLGFTDHDRNLIVGGVVCRAGSGWSTGTGESGTGLTAGSFVASGVLDDAGLNGTDIDAGHYDGARVALWRVDWDRPDLKVLMWTATVSRIRREGEAFTAELEGPLAALERVVGRTYGRDCDALLGDGRCRVDRAEFPGLGCDKRWATCIGTFGNGANFQGFPDIPGDDFLTAHPTTGARSDGGSRR